MVHGLCMVHGLYVEARSLIERRVGLRLCCTWSQATPWPVGLWTDVTGSGQVGEQSGFVPRLV